ncbi:MAG: hypothetical protein AB7K73_03490 [Gammaproteobacteria bacterium]
MTLRTYSRLELAENQLRAAIGLFVSGGDRFSVISLAGAADVLLSRLVLNTGQENFTESALRREMERGGQPVTREEFGKGMNDTLFINQIKHMDNNDDEYIEFDPEECALGAILKAIANYATLGGRNRDFVLAFMAWVKLNLDPEKYNVDCDPNWAPSAQPHLER